MVYSPHGHDIAGAVDKLGDEINCTCVTYEDIAKAFRGMHPYHLNQVALGILKAVKSREGDGRIYPSVEKAAKEIWK